MMSLFPDRRGVSASEFAVAAPVLVLLLLGAYDVANVIQLSLRLERAARAGAGYAVVNPSNLAAVQSAVIAAWPSLTSAEVPLPVLACECAGAAAACTATCASGLVKTITITARRSVSPLLLSGMSEGTGSAVVRIR
jgi:Flp pilus assembly protein TadG